MKTILLLIAFLLLSSVDVGAQPREFLNVGVRFGWFFGSSGGPLVGIEASYTWFDFEGTHGPVVGADYYRGDVRVHAGYELVAPRLPVGGIEVGPTLRLTDDETELGLHATAFFGLAAYPYYSATVYRSGVTHEYGVYLKAPIQIDDRPVVNF